MEKDKRFLISSERLGKLQKTQVRDAAELKRVIIMEMGVEPDIIVMTTPFVTWC